MRTVYLLRHGEPEFPEGKRLCISRTDLPLSLLGRMQGALLGAYFENIPLGGVYHTPLLRARQTASFISPEAEPVEGLEELGVGLWEGLTFDEIRARWLREYTQRGSDPAGHLIPGGEEPEACRTRAEKALHQLLERTENDIAVVCHAGVNRLLLTRWMNLPLKEFLNLPQPYGCMNVLQFGKKYKALKCGSLPMPVLDDQLCQRLWAAADTPEPVRRHCQAVANKALAIAEPLVARGHKLNLQKLRAAALLHDIARTQKKHAAVGAECFNKLGYPEIADIIAIHHDFPQKDECVSEAAILCLADKLTQEEREVTLEERFAQSIKKCCTPQAMKAHQWRLKQAQRLEHILMEGKDGGCG